LWFRAGRGNIRTSLASLPKVDATSENTDNEIGNASNNVPSQPEGRNHRRAQFDPRRDSRFDQDSITIKTYADNNITQIDLAEEAGGHRGGDAQVMREWLLALVSRDDRHLVANAQASLKTHSIVFAAEKSRREGITVEIMARG